MGKHSAPVSAGSNLQTAQFGKHRSVFSSSNPSFGTRVREDMKRRQSGMQAGAHAKPGKHAKAYDVQSDIDKSLGDKKPYHAKHDKLGLNKPKPAPGKVTKNYGPESKRKPVDHKKLAAKIRSLKSRHEGKNKEHIKAMSK